MVNRNLLDGGGGGGVEIEFWSTPNIHNPGTLTLLVVSMFTIADVCDPSHTITSTEVPITPHAHKNTAQS